MSDLIHREAARLIALEYISDSMERRLAIEAIRALPAAQTKTDDFFFALPVTLTYTNWRGEKTQRTIVPRRVWFGSNDWHPNPQWLLTALDTEKGEERDFALKDFGNPAVQPDAAAIQEAAFREVLEIARDAMLGFEALQTVATRGGNSKDVLAHSSAREAARQIFAAISALIDKPGKEVMPDDNDSTHPRSDTAPAGLSAGGGAGWQPIETAPKDRVVDLGQRRGFGTLTPFGMFAAVRNAGLTRTTTGASKKAGHTHTGATRQNRQRKGAHDD